MLALNVALRDVQGQISWIGWTKGLSDFHFVSMLISGCSDIEDNQKFSSWFSSQGWKHGSSEKTVTGWKHDQWQWAWVCLQWSKSSSKRKMMFSFYNNTVAVNRCHLILIRSWLVCDQYCIDLNANKGLKLSWTRRRTCSTGWPAGLYNLDQVNVDMWLNTTQGLWERSV